VHGARAAGWRRRQGGAHHRRAPPPPLLLPLPRARTCGRRGKHHYVVELVHAKLHQLHTLAGALERQLVLAGWKTTRGQGAGGRAIGSTGGAGTKQHTQGGPNVMSSCPAAPKCNRWPRHAATPLGDPCIPHRQYDRRGAGAGEEGTRRTSPHPHPHVAGRPLASPPILRSQGGAWPGGGAHRLAPTRQQLKELRVRRLNDARVRDHKGALAHLGQRDLRACHRQHRQRSQDPMRRHVAAALWEGGAGQDQPWCAHPLPPLPPLPRRLQAAVGGASPSPQS
jgi:hypothetical protein